jgi:predicted metalloprotease with PDZ domain
MRRLPRRELSLLGGALAASLWASPAFADDPVCDYDLTVLDRAASKVEITVACDPALKVQKFTALGDRKHWSTEAATYRDGRGDFKYELGAFAAEQDDMGSGMPYGDGVLVTPAFLLPLPETDAAAMLRFRVTFADGGAIHTALQPDADGRYAVPLSRIDEVGPLLLGEVTTVSLVDDPELTLALPNGVALTAEVLTAWVDAVAESNRRFWGRSPAQHGLVILIPSLRGGVPFGRVLSLGGSVVTVLIGKSATARDLYDDWVLVHEFLHLGSPMMRDAGPWLNEGIATFYEPVLRARAGWKSEDEVWREWISQMPRGLPAMTGIGLSNAGRGGIYWGGALFVLMAEIELLQASQGQYGFSDCLRRVLADGGDATTKWPTMRLLQSCDKAIGQDVVRPLAQRHMAKGSAMSLDEIWQKLGVTLSEDGKITYDDSAELAWLRPLIIWGGAEHPAPIPATGFYTGG